MSDLQVGVAQVSLLMRHAVSLKDKRRVVQGLVQKLKNQGFAASPIGYEDEPKRAIVAFSAVGESASQLEQRIDDALRLFVGDYEVLDSQRRVFDFSGEEEENISEDEELKFGL